MPLEEEEEEKKKENNATVSSEGSMKGNGAYIQLIKMHKVLCRFLRELI